MKNPRIYLTLEDNRVLVPVVSQVPELDKKFSTAAVKNANIKGYNEVTKGIISDLANCDDMLYSEAYEYDPKAFTFNFYEVNICSDADYDDMSRKIGAAPEFDYTAAYGKGIENTKKQVSATAAPKKMSAEKKAAMMPKTGAKLIDMIKEQYPCPTISNSGFYVEERNWNFLVRNIMKKVNTILIGPTGTGKTEIIMKIAEMLDLPCSVYDMGSMQDPLTDLLGSHRLENGSSVFDYAKFVADIQKPGIVLLDELSRAPLTANNILFPCLDSRRTLPIEIADANHDRTIKVHPDCVFIATANIGSEYSGTNEIDAALLNRFLPLQLDYLPNDIEIQVLVNRTGIDTFNAEKIVRFFNTIRAKYAAGDLSKSVSTRESLACAEMFVDGFSLVDCVEYIVANKYINNNYNNEFTIVKSIIMEF